MKEVIKMRTNDEIMNYLDELKSSKNLSISEIARRVGMAKSAVSRYFNRTREFPLNRVSQFAKAFNVSPDDILGINEKNKEVQDQKDLKKFLDENLDSGMTYEGQNLTEEDRERLKIALTQVFWKYHDKFKNKKD